MAKVLILGAGTAGTMVANRLRRTLPDSDSITIVDRDDDHQYQPGYVFIPFGRMSGKRVVKSRRRFLPRGVEFVEAEVSRIDAEARKVSLADGTDIDYDWLVVATGTHPRPDLVPGLTDERIWRKSAHEFYTHEGSVTLHETMENFAGGRLLVHVCEMPIKCPVAPLEFAFLAEDFFRKRHIRHKVDITYVTPLDGAFTKPVASRTLGGLLDDRSIRVQADFAVDRVDPEKQTLISFDGRELPFDLLVTVPPNYGAQCIIDSGLGDDAGFVPVDPHSLRADASDRIFVIGDATNVPTSKAGSVAHFEADHFVDNLVAAMNDQPLPYAFDGHANCFVESGRGQALLLDFNYDTQPLTGTFPLPVVGPMRLLGRSRINHWGKLAFEPIYWRMLLPGHRLPVPTTMSMAGKKAPAEADA